LVGWCEYLSSLSRPPLTLEALGECIRLWEELSVKQPFIEEEFKPLTDQFIVMAKYEVIIPDDVAQKMDKLHDHWVFFQESIHFSDTMIKKNKACICVKS